MAADRVLKKPDWLKVRLRRGPAAERLQGLLRRGGLHTVCEEALCPNQGQCWANGRATIMILGGTCTRNCRFCNVSPERPEGCDAGEPRRVADAVAEMGLDEIVITSVTRDDLPDGGAAIWAETVRRIRESAPGVTVEVLVPDFGGSVTALATLLDARPDVFGHNLETVPRLYPAARPQADYARSLDVLRRARRRRLIVKTGIMVGLGEIEGEILALMRDALAAGVDILSVGQYLQPSRQHLPVARYVPPPEFDAYRRQGLELGFRVVVAAPLVRSSFHAEEQTVFVSRRLGRTPARRGPAG